MPSRLPILRIASPILFGFVTILCDFSFGTRLASLRRVLQGKDLVVDVSYHGRTKSHEDLLQVDNFRTRSIAHPMSETTTATPAASPTPAAAPPKPAAPAKPAAKPAAKAGADRRSFLFSWVFWAWTTFTASMIGMLLGTVRFLFPNVLSEPPSRVKVGFPDQYEDGKVVERFKDQNIWVVRNSGVIYALSTTCTHLGCTPNWLEREEKFKCPCHGSGFKISGVNFEGPAPRPLERWAISVGEDGQLVVDKSKKFQKEMGQWDNPESYYKV